MTFWDPKNYAADTRSFTTRTPPTRASLATATRFRRELAEFLAVVKYDPHVSPKLVLIGHSMGGLLAKSVCRRQRHQALGHHISRARRTRCTPDAAVPQHIRGRASSESLAKRRA